MNKIWILSLFLISSVFACKAENEFESPKDLIVLGKAVDRVLPQSKRIKLSDDEAENLHSAVRKYRASVSSDDENTSSIPCKEIDDYCARITATYNKAWFPSAESASLCKICEKRKKVYSNIDTRNKNDETALMIAARRGEIEAVQALLAADADKDAREKDGSTALIIAIRWGETEAVQALLAAGADQNACEEGDYTPLMIAAGIGKVDIMQALLAAGADQNAFVNRDYKIDMMPAGLSQEELLQALMASYLAHRAWGDPIDVMKENVANAIRALLANKEASSNKCGCTALMLAVWNFRTELVQLLLAAGADKDACAKDGYTALMIAKRLSHSEIVKLLE